MEDMIEKYAGKLISAGLGSPSGPCRPLIGGLDDRLVWNRRGDETKVLAPVFQGLHINSLAFLRPCAPYDRIISYLAQKAATAGGVISPKDCETRTFLHDLPVIRDFSASALIQTLKKRKSVIVLPQTGDDESCGPALIAHGSVSPEQGFVTLSSVCFACFVKFFADYLEALQDGTATDRDHTVYDQVLACLEPCRTDLPSLARGPFQDGTSVLAAVVEAGLKTVQYGLVDSYFGNVSCLFQGTLYISQTGSSLDDLAGCIDPVPMDGSTSAGLTASSELSAHMETISRTGCAAILHGHPRFSVIMSMICDPTEKAACDFSGQCHIRCPKTRYAAGVPIVPGEVGTGPWGLCNTLPPALERSGKAIVYGHGLFTTGKHDFSDAFADLLTTENACRHLYLDKAATLRRNL